MKAGWVKADPPAIRFFDGGMLLLGIAALALGLIGFAFHDFALQWQPVPDGIPLRQPLVYLSAASLVISGALLAVGPFRKWGAAGLTAVFGIWAVTLHLPRVAMDAANIGKWLGLAEITALTAASALSSCLLFRRVGLEQRTLHVIYGVCALIFGVSHFTYPVITAGMVPGWIPFPFFWAYFTGLAHLAAGLAILTGKFSRAATALLALMMGSFALLLHVPRVLANPDSHVEWTMLALACALAGSALLVRASLSSGSPLQQDRRAAAEFTAETEHSEHPSVSPQIG